MTRTHHEFIINSPQTHHDLTIVTLKIPNREKKTVSLPNNVKQNPTVHVTHQPVDIQIQQSRKQSSPLRRSLHNAKKRRRLCCENETCFPKSRRTAAGRSSAKVKLFVRGKGGGEIKGERSRRWKCYSSREHYAITGATFTAPAARLAYIFECA